MPYLTEVEIPQTIEHSCKEDFGSDGSAILGLCKNEHGNILGSRHVEYLDRLFADDLPDEVYRNVLVSYVYLASTCFAIDRVVDGDSISDLDSLAVPLLVGAAQKRILSAFSHMGAPTTPAEESYRFTERVFRAFQAAMITEKRIKESIQVGEKGAEIGNLTNRSVLFVEAYRLLSELRNLKTPEEDLEMLSSFVFFMQRGDDLGDWREDFLSGNYTYFLRRCFEHIDVSATEDELEEFVYLSGAYEQEANFIISGLNEIAERLMKRPNSEGIVAFVHKQSERAQSVLNRFRLTKRKIGVVPREAKYQRIN